MWRAPTLTEVLADVGMTHEPAEFGARHVIKNGERLFTGTASDVWHWLREEGHHFSRCTACSREHTEVEVDLKGVCEECHDCAARVAQRERMRDDRDARGDYMRDRQRGECAS
jgi:hypothetical protein